MGVAPLRAGRDRRCPYSLVAGKQPLVGWPLAAGGASARRQPSCLWGLAATDRPLAADLAVGGRPYMGVSRGWPALHGGLVVAGRPSSLPSLRKRSMNA
ncbi:hypothetical protein GW17_00048711 [Ensete ventricosum]|nr:hypothetical protein GW17_00048711 [Ensete ventricosum]